MQHTGGKGETGQGQRGAGKAGGPATNPSRRRAEPSREGCGWGGQESGKRARHHTPHKAHHHPRNAPHTPTHHPPHIPSPHTAPRASTRQNQPARTPTPRRAHTRRRTQADTKEGGKPHTGTQAEGRKGEGQEKGERNPRPSGERPRPGGGEGKGKRAPRRHRRGGSGGEGGGHSTWRPQAQEGTAERAGGTPPSSRQHANLQRCAHNAPEQALYSGLPGGLGSPPGGGQEPCGLVYAVYFALLAKATEYTSFGWPTASAWEPFGRTNESSIFIHTRKILKVCKPFGFPYVSLVRHQNYFGIHTQGL